MAMTVHVDVVGLERSMFSGLAELIVAPGEAGELGILPHHAPLITRLKPGTVRLKVPNKSEEELFFVSGGVLEVQPKGVTVLADTVLRGKELDEAKALENEEKAEEMLRDKKATMDYAKAQAELAEAIAQLRAIEKFRKM